MKRGAWFLEIRGRAPRQFDELTTQLLDQLPQDEDTWSKLRSKYEVQLRFAIHLARLNRGFGLPAPLAQRIAKLGIPLNFDIYAYQLGVDVVTNAPSMKSENKAR